MDIFKIIFVLTLFLLSSLVHSKSEYIILPGDVLHVSVWNEPELKNDIVVRPDGGINFPLVGEIDTTGLNIDALSQKMSEKLKKFIPDPAVTVTAKQLLGNKIYVIGEVQRPGEFVINRRIDVLQALSMAGGINSYAERASIRIIRRDSDDSQKVFPFNYNEVGNGEDLAQNIILQNGDVVFVR